MTHYIKFGIEALIRLKKKYPEMKAHLIGVPDQPSDLPYWILYTKKATPAQFRSIYNDSMIYMCPSTEEAFGLTGAEAMDGGTVYVLSDYGGVHKYTENGRNVLLSSLGNVAGLVEHVTYLFEHREERIRIEKNGYQIFICLLGEKRWICLKKRYNHENEDGLLRKC